MWGQSDLKKLVAYCTIQEMNLILIVFLWGDSFISICGFFFSAVHAFLSSLMFYLVDCIYRRYHTRSIFAVSGIFTLFPNLGFLIFLMVVFYGGLPGTVKFVCEFYIFNILLSSSFFSCIFLMFTLNFFGLVGFSKGWFNAVFGLPTSKNVILAMDLSKKEFFIIFSSFFFLLFSTFFFLLIL
jgi:NADH:ubiquinone oxidoreductase subunit 4 (subunit M)